MIESKEQKDDGRGASRAAAIAGTPPGSSPGGGSNRVKVEIRKRRGARRFSEARYPGFAYKRTGSRGSSYHWERVLDEEEVAAIAERARRDEYSVRAVPMRYARSADYRRRYLEADPGPYRCRYCHRKLRTDQVTVDHLVPVALAGRSMLARWALARMHADEGVNDLKNLAPACRRCNSRKGAKGGLWIVRGVLGAHRWYWVALAAAGAASVACAAVLLLLVAAHRL